MGHTQRTPEEDYRHYARPEPGRGGNWVEVIDDGSGRQMDADQPPGTFGSAPETEQAGVPAGPEPAAHTAGRSRNPNLWGAWLVDGLMLLLGALWLFGLVEPGWNNYPPPVEVADANGTSGGTSHLGQEVQANLYSLGPVVLVFGLFGTVILLAVQAVMFRRDSRAA